MSVSLSKALSLTPPEAGATLRARRASITPIRLNGTGQSFGAIGGLKNPIRIPGLPGRGVSIGSILAVKPAAFGAFRDFAHYAEDIDDPAKVLLLTATSGVTLDNSNSSGMRRVSATVIAPQDYPVSGGKFAWRRAAFAGVGVRVNAMQAGTSQYVDGAQVEVRPLASNVPTTYAPARAMQIKVLPNRLNYSVNPELQVDKTDWDATPISGTRVAQGSGFALQVDGSTCDHAFSSGTDTPPGILWGARITVSGPNGRVANLRLHDGTKFVSAEKKVLLTGAPIEVVLVPNDVTSGPNVRVHAYPIADGGAWTGGQMLTLTKVLLERVGSRGSEPGPYFTGNSGIDYLWEAGGAAGNTRSYYYRDRQTRAYLLGRLLEENCPLGVIPAVPQFAVLPSE